MAAKKKNFEQAMNRLEEIVRQMEAGEISLEDTVALYKEGVALSVFCEESLRKVEDEVRVLTERPDGTLDADSVLPEE